MVLFWIPTMSPMRVSCGAAEHRRASSLRCSWHINLTEISWECNRFLRHLTGSSASSLLMPSMYKPDGDKKILILQARLSGAGIDLKMKMIGNLFSFKLVNPTHHLPHWNRKHSATFRRRPVRFRLVTAAATYLNDTLLLICMWCCSKLDALLF